MKVLFWGTPEFAVPSLRALAEEGHVVVAVVTQPDRPAGRGRVPRPSPVKIEADAESIPVLQPEKPDGPAFTESIRAMQADISIVAAYGHILSEEVLDLPRLGSFNIHASLLPELRGAAPVNWAIIRGHTHSGVTIMRMVKELDAGPMIYRVAVELLPDTTAGELYMMLSELGAMALIESLAQLEADQLVETAQNHQNATYAPKMGRDMARVDWRLPAIEIDRWIRGCDPWPAAWTELDGTPVQVFKPAVEVSDEGDPGTVMVADPTDGVLVATGAGSIRLLEVKPAGRSRMRAAAWVAGRGVSVEQRFE
jgi:methionyl-tRNA formyltransferase